MTRIPELLAPAGDAAALDAAIRSGTDAVYLGASLFSARSQAANFDAPQLGQAIDKAHLHGLSVYLALNTLIAQDEMETALQIAGRAAEWGVDAIILQDAGLAAELHRYLPDLPLHASTQMTVTDRAGLNMAARLGFSRVILARELTIKEIEGVTAEAKRHHLETEVFVHGALCMSVSGQCLLSSLNGGRSGNRGACAQPCRLPWTLDAAQKDPFPWLSPCDQSLLDGIPDLTRIGVRSLKIEGRMRSADYVGQVVAVYREALDRLQDNNPLNRQERDRARERLLLAFNRGGRFSDRPISGQMGRAFLAGSYSGSYGLLLGTVLKSDPVTGVLTIRSDKASNRTVTRGDVLSVRMSGEDKERASAPVGKISQTSDGWRVQGFHPDVLRTITPGLQVYQMGSQESRRATGRSARTALDLSLSTEAELIRLTAKVKTGPAKGLTRSVETEQEAITPLQPDRVRQQLAKTGGTPFNVAATHVNEPIALSIASLNNVRRKLLEELSSTIPEQFRRQLPDRTSCITDVTLKQEIGTKQIRTTAAFYRLPDSPVDLPCGADQYLLPVLDLDPNSMSLWADAIRDKEPEARILAWLPAGRFGKVHDWLPEVLLRLKTSGYDGVCTNVPAHDLAALLPENQREKAKAWIWQLDDTANLYNACSLRDGLHAGAAAVSPSLELADASLVTLARQIGRGNVEIPVYGRVRVMYNAFCPVGHNVPGCKRCWTKQNQALHPNPGSRYTMTDRQGKAFWLLTHPRVCQVELLQHENIDDLGRAARLEAESGSCCRFQARLLFVEETQAERRQLIKRTRDAWENRKEKP